MSRAVDALRTRLAAIMAGTHTVGDRAVPEGAFVEAVAMSSSISGEWQDVPQERMWEVLWGTQGDEGDAPADAFQGPHTLTVTAVLRVQYPLERVSAFEPPKPGAGGALGVMSDVSQRGLADGESLRYVLHGSPVWEGVAIGCDVGRHRVDAFDALRAVLTMPLTWRVSVSAATSPGWGT